MNEVKVCYKLNWERKGGKSDEEKGERDKVYEIERARAKEGGKKKEKKRKREKGERKRQKEYIDKWMTDR